MATRRHPVITVEADWDGNGSFAHEASDLTPRWLDGWQVTWGSGLTAFAPSWGWQPAAGTIRLDNADG
ncbi:MAG: hypothetical protein OXF27_07010, partial [Acidobacteria bacterium]|nr:hypothetical protein [Acidobacteriota bacterium]